MLILERLNGQSISLFIEGKEVIINLVNGMNGRAKIGIDAPDDTLILRTELLNASPDSFGMRIPA